MSKGHSLYGQATQAIHRAFVGENDFAVTSRTGVQHFIARPLAAGEDIWTELNRVITNYKQVASEMDNSAGNQLFLTGFEQALKNQEYHIKHCIKDAFIDGKHYIESYDGQFYLLRGTNRNESCHRRYTYGILFCA